jgi:hypothetical protein
VQHHGPDCVSVHGQELELGEGAAGGGDELGMDALVERHVAGALFIGDALNDPAVLIDEDIELLLYGVRGVGSLAQGHERTEGDGGVGLSPELMDDLPQVLLVPDKRALSDPSLREARSPARQKHRHA